MKIGDRVKGDLPTYGGEFEGVVQNLHTDEDGRDYAFVFVEGREPETSWIKVDKLEIAR